MIWIRWLGNQNGASSGNAMRNQGPCAVQAGRSSRTAWAWDTTWNTKEPLTGRKAILDIP